MRFHFSSDLQSLGLFIPRFLSLVGNALWFKRADHLDREQLASPYKWKIVSDYHWLEMALSHQSDIFAKEGHLLAEHVDVRTLAALRFAAAVVELHEFLSDEGRGILEGRLRDGLNAETGFAALYLEIELALRLVEAGYDVTFPDMQGQGQFDLEFFQDGFSGEVECKSVSPDAGRQIHRKDFYRFMELIRPELEGRLASGQRQVLVATLPGRLRPSVHDQLALRDAMLAVFSSGTEGEIQAASFSIELRTYANIFGDDEIINPDSLPQRIQEIFGLSAHAAGLVGLDGGCIVVVVRSQKEDDTSKPILEAMRKAASQFSGKRPAFIAVQFQEIQLTDLLLIRLRRRMGILSYALFGHYEASHVNATLFSGFGSVVAHLDGIVTPAFVIRNPQPRFHVRDCDAKPFFDHMPDELFAAALGALPPKENISSISIESEEL